jgi:1-acyl-sn-glycerol-3-phosphate acyltransferase
MQHLRAVGFYAWLLVTTPAICLLLLLCYPLPYAVRYRVGRLWTDSTLWALRRVCALEWSFSGLEHLPVGPAIVMCKHQSAWETMALQQVMPPHTWILKRELLRVPFVGWGLALLDPIAIDRAAGVRAMRTIAREGRRRLERGIWVVVFPEGTRTAPGERRAYHPGGALLAQQTGAPVLPVAHDAGLYWPRASFLKKPGRIRCVVGPPIASRGRDAADILKDVESWIERTCAELQATAVSVPESCVPGTSPAPEADRR